MTSPAPLPSAANASLAEALLPRIAAHDGRVCLAIKHLKTDAALWHQADEPMPTASLIKIPVLIELYRRAERGQVDLDELLTLSEADRTPGAGVLTPHFSPGLRISIRDLARLMIAFSDNTATNRIIQLVGLASVSRTMEQLDCPNTRLHAFVYRRETSIEPERSDRFGVDSTTAAEMLRLLERLWRGDLAGPPQTAEMLGHLRACQHRSMPLGQLPEATSAAFKTGYFEGIRTAAGVIDSAAGPWLFAFLSADNRDQTRGEANEAERLCSGLIAAADRCFSAH